MRKTLFIAVVTTLALPAVARADDEEDDGSKARPGRDTVKPMKPDWCAGYRDDGDADRGISDRQRRIERSGKSSRFGYEWQTLLAQFACKYPADAGAQAFVARERQKFLNETGLSEKDDRAAMKVRVDGEAWQDERDAFCRDNRPGDEAGRDARAEANVQGRLAWCESAYDPFDFWYYDARAELPSEAHRALLVVDCLDRGGVRAELPDPDDDHSEAAYARCGADARALDKTRLEAELGAGKVPEWRRLPIRIAFARAKIVADHLTAAYQKRAAKDPDWKRLLFDAPQGGWSAWEKAVAPWRAEYDAALAYEPVGWGASEKASQGCEKKLEPGFEKWLRSLKPKSYEDAKARLVDDPIGVALVSHLAACHYRNGRDAQGTLLWGLMEDARYHRGPRQAAFFAALSAYSDIVADRANLPLEEEAMTRFSGDRFRPDDVPHSPFGEPGQGEVEKLKKHDNGNLTIHFKTVTWIHELTECTPTKRILGVHPNGDVQYEQKCRPAGKEKRSFTEEPMVIPAALAAGIEKGYVGVFETEREPPEGKMRYGYPVEIYQDAKRTKLAALFGVELK